MATLQTTSAGTCCSDKMSGTVVTYSHHPGVGGKGGEGKGGEGKGWSILQKSLPL